MATSAARSYPVQTRLGLLCMIFGVFVDGTRVSDRSSSILFCVDDLFASLFTWPASLVIHSCRYSLVMRIKMASFALFDGMTLRHISLLQFASLHLHALKIIATSHK